MTPEQFVYWLQGFSELSQTAPTERQWVTIQDHLAQVFNKQTPVRDQQLNLPFNFQRDPEQKPPKHNFVC